MIRQSILLTVAWLSCWTAWAQEPVQDFSEEAFFGNTQDQVRQATPADQLSLPEGFRAELLYTVPLEEQGSWVCLTTDDRGRLIASAQWGGLYRITPPQLNADASAIHVEPIELDIGNAQGLLYAHGSLYVVMSSEQSGLYRVRDTDGDDQFDSVTLLREFEGDGEHGPHAVVLAPDGQGLYVVGGNGSYVTLPPEKSLVPRTWQEDRLLRRMGASDGAFETERPGAWICRTDLEGTTFELVAMGMRNPYDIAFNSDGELFTFDSDMEWDEGTPWYRQTRVNHVTSGADFGWRAGTAKWPDDYFDSVGTVVDVGFSSPTGVSFGSGARFPARYQRALFIADWSLGNIYAVHLTPSGATYQGELERFATAAPLPVTDLVIRPQDGCLYFTTGGRGITSALYRIRYVGEEATELVRTAVDRSPPLRETRRQLESFHGRVAPEAVEQAWPYLAHDDRAIRYAARVTVEFQPVNQWQERALDEPTARGRIAALLALARHTDKRLFPRISRALSEIRWSQLQDEDRLDLLRAHMVLLSRAPQAEDLDRDRILAQLDEQFPSGNARLDRELAEILTYLQAPDILPRLLAALAGAKTQEEQIHFAMCLREVKHGWNTSRYAQYLSWFRRVAAQGGGVSFSQYIEQMREEIVDRLSRDQKSELAEVLRAPPVVDPYSHLKQRPVIKEWTVDELLPIVESASALGNPERGAEVFAAAACFRCHRFQGQGGVTGPDLSGVARRFQMRDILEAIIEPSRVVSDQYRAVQLIMEDGRVLSGKIRDQSGNVLLLMNDPANSANLSIVQRDEIDEMTWSPISLMPEGLLNTFTEEEILDLLAFLKQSAN